MNRYKNLLYALVMVLISCSSKPEVYNSVCGQDKIYERVEMDNLLVNISDYDGKYVEVRGKYRSGFEESALYGKGFHHNTENALWVEFDDFILKCPLTSSVNKTNLFGKEESFKNMFNRTVMLHGRIDAEHQGHLSGYKATIRDITLVVIE